MSEAPVLKRRSWRPLLAVAGVLVVVGAFLAGRASSPGAGARPAPMATDSGEHGEHGDEHEGEEHAKDGVIRFEPESLRLADLKVEPVGFRTTAVRLPLTGIVEANPSGLVKITPRVTGKITGVMVNVGDTVRAGQTLAVQASTELAEAQATYEHALHRVKLAQSNLGRQRKLARLGVFGQPRMEEARTRATAARGEASEAEEAVSEAKNEVAEARSEAGAAEADVARAQSDVASAESAIEEAEGKVRALQAAFQQANTGIGAAESRFNRLDRLIKEELVSRQDWEQAQADVQRARAALEAARADVAQGQAGVESARARLRAAQAGVRSAAGRREQAMAKVQTALARQRQREARLATARGQAEIQAKALAREEAVLRGAFSSSKEIIEAEEAMHEEQHELEAASTKIGLLGGVPGMGNLLRILAPIDGRITERAVSLGETVQPERALFTLVNLRSVWVQLAVRPEDLPRVSLGAAVTITSDTAPGRVFSGRISYIGHEVDPETRTIQARAAIRNAGDVLKPRTFVRASLTGDAGASHLAVPSAAVQTLEGRKVVFVAGEERGEFLARPVTPGETRDGWTAIEEGLAAGEQVVVQGAFTVKGQAEKAELGDDH